MLRPARLIATAFVATVGVSALAQGPTMRAELATAQDGTREIVLDGRLWTCTGNACIAAGDDPRPAIACRKLARKLGSVIRFETRHGDLDAAGLATCNQDQE